MTVYNIYIFDKNGALLFYNEWNRKKQTGISKQEEAKLMYGMIFSLKSFVSKISPVDFRDGYFNYSTNKYKLHFYESPTRLKIIMNTDLCAVGIRDLLHQIYTQVYVDYAILNPLYELGKPIESDLFASKLHEVVKQNPAFVSRIT